MLDISRRAAVHGITSFGGLLLFGKFRVAVAQTPIVRRDVTQLGDFPDDLARFREAVAALKGKMIGGRSGWDRNADLHGEYCTSETKDIHGTWWFLPWHRAYLHATERNLQQALGDAQVALPYWHWPRTAKVPDIYRAKPLNHERDPYIDLQPFLMDLTGMGAPSFRGRVESNFIVERGFGGYSRSSDLASSIEGVPHGALHIMIGQDMSQLARAAYDPIFFAHHANIDRLWEVWRTPSDGAHALSEPWDIEGFAHENGKEISWSFFDVAAPEKPYQVSVSKTRNTVELGYTYSPIQALPPEFFAMAKFQDDLEQNEPNPELLGTQADTSFIAANGPGQLESFAGEGFIAPGTATLSLTVEVPAQRGVILAVYLSDLNQPFKLDSAVYAGLISVVATGTHATKAKFALDVTQALQQLQASGDKVGVTAIPVRRTPTDPAPGPLAIEKTLFLQGPSL